MDALESRFVSMSTSNGADPVDDHCSARRVRTSWPCLLRYDTAALHTTAWLILPGVGCGKLVVVAREEAS